MEKDFCSLNHQQQNLVSTWHIMVCPITFFSRYLFKFMKQKKKKKTNKQINKRKKNW